MADYVPFVYTQNDASIVRTHYAAADVVRIPLRCFSQCRDKFGKHTGFWLDGEIDGFQRFLRTNPENLDRAISKQWRQSVQKFRCWEHIADEAFHQKPIAGDVQHFVDDLLQEYKSFQATWLSVPQLPWPNDNSHNRINKALARASQKSTWRSSMNAQFVLPVIFEKHWRLEKKGDWSKNLSSIKTCFKQSGAQALWVVFADIDDQAGTGTGRLDKRFQNLIALHEELKNATNARIIIAGPYWGMNLVLWARGLVTHPAIGAGRAYRYYLSGAPGRTGNARLAIPPIRRCVVCEGAIKSWLEESLGELPTTDEDHKTLKYLRDKWAVLRAKKASRENTAKFYGQWYDRIATHPKDGRQLALFQDLSRAYVLGKRLPALPKGAVRGSTRPEKAAEQYMLRCL